MVYGSSLVIYSLIVATILLTLLIDIPKRKNLIKQAPIMSNPFILLKSYTYKHSSRFIPKYTFQLLINPRAEIKKIIKRETNNFLGNSSSSAQTRTS